MKKIALLVLAAAFVLAMPASAQTFLVPDDGDFTAAVNALNAATHDVVNFNGDYTEQVPNGVPTITVSDVTIDGGTNDVVLDLINEGGTFLSFSGATGVVVRNLTIERGESAALAFSNESDNALVENLVIRQFSSRYAALITINVNGGDNITIRGCDIWSAPFPATIPNPKGGAADYQVDEDGRTFDARSARAIVPNGDRDPATAPIDGLTIEDCVIGPMGEAGLRAGGDWWWDATGMITDDAPSLTNLTVRNNHIAAVNGDFTNGAFDGDLTFYKLTRGVLVEGNVLGEFPAGTTLPRGPVTELIPANQVFGPASTDPDEDLLDTAASSQGLRAQNATQDAQWLNNEIKYTRVGSVIQQYFAGSDLGIQLEGNLIHHSGSTQWNYNLEDGFSQTDFGGACPANTCFGPYDHTNKVTPVPTITDVTADSVSGTSVPNAVVEVGVHEIADSWYYNDGTDYRPGFQVILGTTTADSNGDWSLTSTDLGSTYNGYWLSAMATGPGAEDSTSNFANVVIGGAGTDLDDDGLDDAWETKWGLNPSDQADGADVDSDGDGFTNGEEQAATLGTSDPLNPDSTPLNPGPNGEPLPAAGALGLLVLGGALALAASRRRK